jgi:hypothetical protein
MRGCLFCAGVGSWLRRWNSGIPRQIAGKNKSQQGEQDEKSRDVKKPIVAQGPIGRFTGSVAFVGVMMVFAHESFFSFCLRGCVRVYQPITSFAVQKE